MLVPAVDELYKPCPFCGAKEGAPNAGGPLMLGRHDVTGLWSVDCLSCGAEGPQELDMIRAAEKWNTREGVDHG